MFYFSNIKPSKHRTISHTMKVLTTTVLICILFSFLAVFIAHCDEIVEDEWLSIEHFHRKLDKDEDGTLRQSEIISDVNEYNSIQGTKLDVNFDETPLSLRNLMQQWTQNLARSWTPRQVAEWAKVTVKMPEILTQIHDKKISGTTLPILAVDRDQIIRIFPGLDSALIDKLMLYAFKLVITGPSHNEIPSPYDDSNKDWVAFEQIVVFFKEMDKDDDGCVDMDEADGERDGPALASSTPCDEISIEHRTLSEVWEYWSKFNPVRNWTVDEVSAWLEQENLGKYIETFKKHKVIGLHLPRIAANAKTAYLRELNVNKEDRKKLMISAITLVLFGPSKVVTQSNLLADIFFAIFCVAVSTGALWYGYNQRKLKMQFENKFVDSECSLDQIKQQMKVLNEIEKAITAEQELEIPKVVTQEIEIETQQEDNARIVIKFETPEELISLLRYTYLREYEFYDLKKLDIEQLIDKARRQHENLKRKHGNILSALFISNTRVLDNNEVLMVDTKSRLERLTQDMHELNQRWQKIESLTQSTLIQHYSTRRAQSQHSLLSYGSHSTLNTIDTIEVSEYTSLEIESNNVAVEVNDSLKDPSETEMLRSTSCPGLNIIPPSVNNGDNESSERRKKASIKKSLAKPIKKYMASSEKNTEGDSRI